MSRCCYPGCYLDEHEDGDHKLGRPEKPWGEIRLVQEFVFVHMRCETCEPYLGIPLHAAAGFYADMLGFGWALCDECRAKFTTSTTEDTKAGEPELDSAPPLHASVVNICKGRRKAHA